MQRAVECRPNESTHPALVSDADLLAAQQVTALAILAMPEDGRVHRYQLTGLVVCAACGRRMEGHWVNRRPGYRRRHGHTSVHPADPGSPRWVYWSQARIVEEILATGDSELRDQPTPARSPLIYGHGTCSSSAARTQ
ncbi:zinc ribbon domain-containing protein [Paractinoplanes globisporus]|uniref:Zinc ribbon domain-containing protein n=1 Tax=Paractinoplanes globisporus TaxID=113565 RepID=A0ABW6WG22_9ACTN|nr:zinc ribbon domain-containing protein [Actinoplanes globisporus]